MPNHLKIALNLYALVATLTFCLGLTHVYSIQASDTDSRALAQLWVHRLSATMEEHASVAEVDRLLEMYSDDAVYEHPHAGARIEGKALLRKGMSSHLGETRNPQIQVIQTILGKDFVVAELKVKLEIRDNAKWVLLERRQVVVFEIKDSRIQRIMDHWGE